MTKITPMMQQYMNVRDKNPGFLLFYRMGDFYELFGDHAVKASSILGITLTRRRTAKEGDEGIPMCGVPFHAAEGYIAKLIKAGEKVALCEQTETPEEAKKRGGAKALVKREVIRLYTGGTLTEDSMLKPQESNYLVALHSIQGTLTLGWMDLSTGEFAVTGASKDTLTADLARLDAKEVILTESVGQTYADELHAYAERLTILTSSYFNEKDAEARLLDAFRLKTLEALTLSTKGELSVCRALISYAQDTQKGKLPTLQYPRVLKTAAFVNMDVASRQNLELTETLRGERKGSLLEAIDRTVTSSGSRALAGWINAPLRDLEEIHRRQTVIEQFTKDIHKTEALRDTLKKTTDTSRSLSRITLERGSPRDLVSVRTTLRLLPDIMTQLTNVDSKLFTAELRDLTGFEQLRSLLDKSLNEEDIPMLARDGGYIKEGFCPQFDEYKNMTIHGMDMLRELERAEGERTGITNLRIKYNKVWGYFMEVSKGQADKVPEDFIHRQTTTNSQRFSSTTLMELERKYSAAEANSLSREVELFNEVTAATKAMAPELLKMAEALAQLDVLSAGAELALSHNYCKPDVDGSNAFIIKNGRHPVVEQTVERYVANSSDLSDHQLWLMTGPNMAGKSTFLRQNALIALMAHMGYWVPAETANIGLVDRIFTRIGAGDDLASGKSTFMMEMVETASILNNATDKSLVILDEIGRGTATYDGLSIAWACVEHIVNTNKSRGLFATHYHEMTVLEEQLAPLSCHHVQVKEWEGDIIFLHSVGKGAAPHSYGVHVGRLAGLPLSVTNRAASLLKKLESQGTPSKEQTEQTLPLFNAEPEIIHIKEPSRVEEHLETVDIDNLSPREAHSMLYDLKGLLN